MIDSLYTGLIFTTKVCKFSSELMLHSRSKFSTSSNIINTQQIKHPSDILNFTSRRNILFSRIFNSSLFRSTITTTIPFLCIISLSRLERKRRGAVFFPRRKEGSRHPLRLSAGNPDPIFPCRRVPLKATHSSHPYVPSSPSGCSLCRAIATKRNKTSTTHLQ